MSKKVDDMLSFYYAELEKAKQAEISYLELINDLIDENEELRRELLIAQGKYYEDYPIGSINITCSDSIINTIFKNLTDYK